MTPSGSIGRRLTVLLACVAALLSVLSWSMVSSFARQAAERTQDNILAASATTIAEALRSEGDEIRLELPYAAFSMLGAISQDRVFYHVDVDGQTLTGYSDLAPDLETPAPGQISFGTVTYRQATLRMVSITRVVLAGADPVPVTVSVAQTRDGISAIATDLSRTAALLCVAFFVLAVVLSAFVARSSLNQLTTVAEAVARRGPSDLRPLRDRAPTELAPLIQSLNRFIDRLGTSLRRSEEFITEAAHRVRTPLATVRAQAEVALHSARGDEEKVRLRRMIRAIDESSRSAGQLLDHATVAFRADSLAHDAIDLAVIARTVTSALEPTAEMKDIAIELASETVIVSGDGVLLESALRNVVDNAIKYSSPDTTVRIGVSAEGAQAQVRVVDEGPGLGAGPYDRFTERFHRGDNAEGVVGSGLGLTIANEVLVAHGGHIVLAQNEEGRGACVTLCLPLASGLA